MSRAPDFNELAVEGVRELRPYTPGKPIEELEREYGIRDSIKLASNENPLGAAPAALAAIRAHVDEIWLYPDANGYYLKQALARHHGVEPACITLGDGSNEVLVFLAQAFLRPGVSAVFSQYAFAVYPIVTRMTGARAEVVPALGSDDPMALGHDLRAIYQRVGPDTRMVFIANPNNPTGTWLTAGRLEDFIASLPPHVICVVDQAYAEYTDSRVLGDAAGWLAKYPNLVVTQTFSKAYGLAGLRVGYGLSHPDLADLLNRVRPAFNVNALALHAAHAALADQAFIAHSRAVNDAGLKQLGDGLRALGVWVGPSAANFVLARFDRSGALLNEALLRRGVIVRPVANYGLEPYLRITVGTEAQNQRLLDCLKDILDA